MFSKSAALYDAVYAATDSEREAQRLRVLIQKHKRSDGARLLDVACGTGNHLTFFKHWYAVEGLDLRDPEDLTGRGLYIRTRPPGK